jgi:glycine betaine/proline transport system substrate-binding protein
MRTTIRTAAFAAGLALLASACASGIGGDDDDGGEGAEGEEVTLVANPWPGSFANAHVAQQVMESELGADVEITEIDENAQWSGLDGGELDAVLEVWPSGHAENYATYIEELGSVEDLGELGAVGQIGWFVPTYVVDEYPDMATWEGLEGDEGIFATSETGDSGRFLAADPSFVQFDETIIENLGLDLEVVQSGSEAAQLTEVQAALDAEEPVLFYFYTPHWMHARYDLSLVELPEYEEGCEEPEEERTCGYPEDVLFKAVAADLDERAPQSYEFLDNFQMENEWQDEITLMIDEEGMDPADAAAAWIEDNEDAWSAWLP